ncbi:MAG: hypothetical protein RL026_2053 [Pseudomonadota bacterium]
MNWLRYDTRPYALGLYPAEALPRDSRQLALEAAAPALAAAAPGFPLAAMGDDALEAPLSRALAAQMNLFATQADGPVAGQRAPVPDDLQRRATDIKGAALFLNADQVGITTLPDSAWREGSTRRSHGTAIVLLLELARLPADEPLAASWCRPARRAAACARLAEIAAVLAGYVRRLGWSARADIAPVAELDAERLAVMAGLVLRDAGQLRSPFFAEFALAVVSTDYPLPQDLPLQAQALPSPDWRRWWGRPGTRSTRERTRRQARPSHSGLYPVEQLRRVPRPTTLILDDEVPRVPKRAAFFERALRGDLGAKAQRERPRFSLKHPLSDAMAPLLRGLVPLQGGAHGRADGTIGTAGLTDAAANSRALKALAGFLGAEMTGICEIPRYAWYSHKENGAPIEPYHRYAVVMLIDQEFATMEGASGDDWISGSQSMRGYLRGASIAGAMAGMLRGMGVGARSHTNADSDLLHIPLLLWAGLGELSRIGELVLNPFVGPRFKSVVLSTDLPLQPDQPIDFGLQTFCEACRKCARECPCDAIPHGPKVMFNGYEIWKPDVERCTRYRVTNPDGSACGRCMKTCPINKVVDADGPLLVRAASWAGLHLPWAKRWMAPLAAWADDALGHGRRNPAKRWWLDLEMVEGCAVAPAGANAREIDPTRRAGRHSQRIAIYPAAMNPPADAAGAVPVDRKAALAAARTLESPEEARRRRAGR